MRILGWVVAGAIVGIVGALAWAGVGIATGRQMGIIAWGVGLVVGVAVKLAAQDERGWLSGAIAAVIALSSALGARYMLLPSAIRNAAERQGIVANETACISYVADEIAEQWEGNGVELRWPAPQSTSRANAATDYPDDVWREADTRWRAMDGIEQSAYRTMAEAEIDDFIGSIRAEYFWRSIGPMGFLFIGLATITAGVVGSGARD